MGYSSKLAAGISALSLTVGCGSGDHVPSQKNDELSAAKGRSGTDDNATIRTATTPDAAQRSAVMERIRIGEYAVRLRDSDLHAHNRAQRFEAIWKDGSVRVQVTPPHEDAPPSTKTEPTKRTRPTVATGFEMRTVAIARGVARVRAPAGEFSLGSCRKDGAVDEMGSCLRRAESRQAGFIEWWENRADGLEQGFDLEKPPIANDGKAPLRLEVDVQGAGVRIDKDGQGATLTLRDGTELRYGGLYAKDAHQTSLPIRLVAGAGGLSIEIDDRDATYPLHVDPLITSSNWWFEPDQTGAFMANIESAGDVNGDGYGDVMVSAPGYDGTFTNEGRVWIFHGASGGLSSSASRILSGPQADALFGDGLAGLGDVNGDGFGDIAVAASGYSNGQAGEGIVYVYHGSASGIPATASRSLEINEPNSAFGSPAAAGDVNADGFADLLVGCGFCDTTGQLPSTNGGRFYVYHGSASGIPATAARTVTMIFSFGFFGISVSGAGDVNGDGYSDILIGAPGLSSGGETEEGYAIIYHGSASGIPATAATVLQLNKANARLGEYVAGVGDTNGDGYSDILVSATGSGSLANERVLLYRGSSTGISATPHQKYTSTRTSQFVTFGWAIGGAGDIDGDGLADFVIGEPQYTNDQDQEGALHIFYGPANTSTAAQVIEGNRVQSHYASKTVSAGDVNGDGYSDVGAAAWGWDNPSDNEGRTFVYRGSPSSVLEFGSTSQGDAGDLYGSSVDVGDITGDGLDDLVVGAPGADRAYVVSGAADWSGNIWNKLGSAGSKFGSSVAVVGDVNADGFEDVLVGAPQYSNGQTQEGRAELYHGGPTGPGTTPVWTYESNQAGALFGKAVAAAGDVNGDGYPDVIIGAPSYTNGSFTAAGAAFVFFGSASGLATSPSVTLLGTQSNASLGSALANGDFNRDGYSDIAVSAPFYTNDQTREGVVFIHHGSTTGPSTTATKMLEGTQADAEFGSAIANAGDTQTNGYADFVVGSPRYDGGQTDEGRISLYWGSATGLGNAVQNLESNVAGAFYGAAVAGVGDINGDFRSDVTVGAPGLSPGGGTYNYTGHILGVLVLNQSFTGGTLVTGYGAALSRGGDMNGDGFSDYSEGAPLTTVAGQTSQGALVHRGGGGSFFNTSAVAKKVKQRRVSTTTLIAARQRSDSATSFQAAALSGRAPAGRTRVKLQVEVKSLGTAFDGTGLATSSSWVDTGLLGTALGQTITRPTGDRTHWRARLLYEPTRSPGAWHQRSRWYYGGDPREPVGVHVRIP